MKILFLVRFFVVIGFLFSSVCFADNFPSRDGDTFYSTEAEAYAACLAVDAGCARASGTVNHFPYFSEGRTYNRYIFTGCSGSTPVTGLTTGLCFPSQCSVNVDILHLAGTYTPSYQSYSLSNTANYCYESCSAIYQPSDNVESCYLLGGVNVCRLDLAYKKTGSSCSGTSFPVFTISLKPCGHTWETRDPVTHICNPEPCSLDWQERNSSGVCVNKLCPTPSDVRSSLTGLCFPSKCPNGGTRDPVTVLCASSSNNSNNQTSAPTPSNSTSAAPANSSSAAATDSAAAASSASSSASSQTSVKPPSSASASDNSAATATNTAISADNSAATATNTKTAADNSVVVATNTKTAADNSAVVANNTKSIADNSAATANNSKISADNSEAIAQNTAVTAENTMAVKDALEKSGAAASADCTPSGAVVSCDADPVNCALLSTQASFNCVPTDDAAPDATISLDSSTSDSLAEGLTSDFHSNDVTEDLTDMLDYSGYGLDRSCPAPNTYQLGSLGSFSVDISIFCDLAEIVGVFVVACASIISLRIISV